MEQKVTALKVQKRNPHRVNVYLDGEFSFGLSRVTAAWLEIGQVIDQNKISELQTADEHEVAYQKALNFLSYRPRSEKEILDKLRKHEFLDKVAHDTLQRLKQNHLVNDLDFARIWVENRSAFRPRGRRALTLELRQKGITGEVIDEVLQDLDEDELAYQAALKQVRKYHGMDWKAYRQKMVAFLARRGFNYGVAAPITKRVWAEHFDQPDLQN